MCSAYHSTCSGMTALHLFIWCIQKVKSAVRMSQADRQLVMILFVVQTVSYAQFLYPTNALDHHKPAVDLTLPMPYSRNSIPCSYPPSRLNSTVGLDLGMSHTYTHTNTHRLVRTSYRPQISWRLTLDLLYTCTFLVIEQGCFTLIKCYSEDLYNGTKDFCFK